MRLHIIRHGDPNYELDALTEYGKIQAEALSKRLETLPVEEIYSSPMGRARETASYTAAALGMPISILNWAREVGLPGMYADAESTSKLAVWNLPPDRLKTAEAHPEGWINAPELSPPKAFEVFSEIETGWQEFLHAHGIEIEGGKMVARDGLPKGDILLFCHFGFGLALLAIILELPVTLLWRAFFLQTTSVTTIAFQKHKDIVSAKIYALGDTGHLLGINKK